ncbi:unnamed protein product [Camellia sinensis]
MVWFNRIATSDMFLRRNIRVNQIVLFYATESEAENYSTEGEADMAIRTAPKSRLVFTSIYFFLLI